MANPDVSQAAAFAKEHGLYAVAMPDYMADRGLCRKLAAGCCFNPFVSYFWNIKPGQS
jgi:hypothetical protein